MASGETYEVRFKVTVNDPGAGNPVPAIINTARIAATSDANVIFVDDGTAIMNPEAGALPVSLLNFKVSLAGDHQANISWSTSLEMNCKYYDVQRSMDGNIFTTIATLPGHGTSSLQHDYTFKDDISGIIAPFVYFRLSQVDADGQKNYSKIIVLRTKGTRNRISISPNPFSGTINMNFDWKNDEPASLIIINASGKKVFEKQVQMNKGSNYLKADNLLIPPGFYFVQLVSNNEKITMKIVKQ